MNKSKGFPLAIAFIFFFSCGEVSHQCGGVSYDESAAFCYKSNEVYEKCNNEEYDPSVYFCYEKKLYALSDIFFYENKIYEKCNGEEYNPIDTACCNNDFYDRSMEFCSKENKKYSKCAQKEFEPSKFFCHEGETVEYNKCPENNLNGKSYNPFDQFCGSDDEIYTKCGGQDYKVSINFCYENELYPLCKDENGTYGSYDPLKYGCFEGKLKNNCELPDVLGECVYKSLLRCKQVGIGEDKIVDPFPRMECKNDGIISGFVTDNDGNEYSTVQIGRQVWMAENLNRNPPDTLQREDVPQYKDGKPLEDDLGNQVTKPVYFHGEDESMCWKGLKEDHREKHHECEKCEQFGYCYDTDCELSNCTRYFNKDICKVYGKGKDDCERYGRLYDWATVMNTNKQDHCNVSTCNPKRPQGLCPEGWRVPSVEDWEKLIDYMDGGPIAGGRLKAKQDSSIWSGNGYGTDSYGFKAKPGGHYSKNTSNLSGLEGGFWWTSTQFNATQAHLFYVTSADTEVRSLAHEKGLFMFYVRCLQNID